MQLKKKFNPKIVKLNTGSRTLANSKSKYNTEGLECQNFAITQDSSYINKNMI